MNKQREEEKRKRAEKTSSRNNGGAGGAAERENRPPTSGNSFRAPPGSNEEAEYRAFNKKFYEEFRKKTFGRKGHSNKNDKPQAPPKPRSLRPTNRSDTTVTLEWLDGSGSSDGSNAYELQWRARGQERQPPSRGGIPWDTSTQLILGLTVRKKNLLPGTCYEFRLRAASAYGWSAYTDPIMVVTNTAAQTEQSGESADQAASDADYNQNRTRDEAAAARQNVNARRKKPPPERPGTSSRSSRSGQEGVGE